MPLNNEIIDSREFMAMLKIKSMTTFQKRIKDDPDFPGAIVWPPNTRTRGWYREQAEDYVNDLMENATPWSEVSEKAAGQTKSRRDMVHGFSSKEPAILSARSKRSN